MSEIVNKPLLVGDKIMPEMDLKQRGFTYSACASFTKNKEKIKKLNKQEIQDISIKTDQINLALNII